MERNLIFIKPDAVKRGISGEIIERFERTGLKITAMKMLWLTKQQAAKFYPSEKEWLLMLSTKVTEAFAAKGKRFNKEPMAYGRRIKEYLIGYITSGPIIAMVIEGNEAISITRKLTGSTDPSTAQAGTIRGDYCADSLYAANVENRACFTLIHVAGTKKESQDQIKMLFGK